MLIPALLFGRRFIETGLAKADFHAAQNYVLAEDRTAHPTAGLVLQLVSWYHFKKRQEA